jgi:hypothetical protein
VLTHNSFLPWTLGLGLFLGLWSILWVRFSPTARLARWGMYLFTVTFLALGTATFLAAVNHLDGLAPLGILSGLLVVGMVWEGPRPVTKSAPLYDSSHEFVSGHRVEIAEPPALPRMARDGSRVTGPL